MTATQTGPPTIYVLAPHYDRPSGGVRVMYRHVDVLEAAGLRARVLHPRPGFRCTWFVNTTPVTHAAASPVGPEDVLVVGELDIDLIAGAARPVRHILLNQSAHLTWSNRPDLVTRHYSGAEGLLGALVVSDHSRDYLEWAFPSLPVRRVRNSVDPAVFFRAPDPAPPVITCLPRRGADDITQVVEMLRARGVLRGWELRNVGGLGQEAFAEALRGTRLLLSTGYQEGFGLPVAEAMACGALVVGYHAFGGRELMLPEHSVTVDTGDVLSLAKAVEAVIEKDTESPGWCAERGRAAAAFVAREYSPAREAAQIIEAYAGLLEGRPF